MPTNNYVCLFGLLYLKKNEGKMNETKTVLITRGIKYYVCDFYPVFLDKPSNDPFMLAAWRNNIQGELFHGNNIRWE